MVQAQLSPDSEVPGGEADALEILHCLPQYVAPGVRVVLMPTFNSPPPPRWGPRPRQSRPFTPVWPKETSRRVFAPQPMESDDSEGNVAFPQTGRSVGRVSAEDIDKENIDPQHTAYHHAQQATWRPPLSSLSGCQHGWCVKSIKPARPSNCF